MYQSHRPARASGGLAVGRIPGSGMVLLAAWLLIPSAETAHAKPFDTSAPTVSVLAEDISGGGVASEADTSGVTISDGEAAASMLPTFSAFGAGDTSAGGDCDQWQCGDFLARLSCRKKACWIGRADALIGWRNAPPNRPLLDSSVSGLPALNANQLESTTAAGPRATILRENSCTGNAWETSYLRLANFRSQRTLATPQYTLAPPGIYGNSNLQPFDSGTVNLGSMIQGLEVNHYRRVSQNIRLLAGFRWVEWQEQFTLSDTVSSTDPPLSDFYQTKCVNDLYGGQIGADARVLSLSWLRIDSLVKAGAYYNNAVQSSLYTFDDGTAPSTASIAVGQSPASCGFVGEVGITGTMPITSCIDFRIGYMGLWLSGIAQPTQQLSGQTLVLPADPAVPNAGSIVTNGGVLVQAVSIGLEGRW